MRRLVAGVASAALLAAAVAAPAAAAAPTYTIVADGLHNPRGLAFSEDGKILYVAEAGLGSGTAATGTQPGLGFSGSISAIRDPQHAPRASRIVTGLLSLAGDEGAIGLDGISVHGSSIYGIMGLSQFATGQQVGNVGHLIRVKHGAVSAVADVGSFDYSWSNEHKSLSPRDFPDANPYGVLAAHGRTYVVDAGTNTLDEVKADGSIRVLAFFPDNALADSTPTCVTQGPDGALYVGTLALFDSFVNGPSAQVYRVDLASATGSESSVLTVATVWASGLWPINGCAFGKHGDFYASQMFTSIAMGPNGPEPAGGDVVRIPFAHPGRHISLTGGTLPWAAGVAVDRSGAVFAVGGAVFSDGFVARLNS